jgi:hypothetical protein
VILKQIIVWFSLVPFILKKCCTLIFCLVFTFGIRCPINMNVSQLPGTVSLPTFYGLTVFIKAPLHSLITCMNPFGDCELYGLKNWGLYHVAV